MNNTCLSFKNSDCAKDGERCHLRYGRDCFKNEDKATRPQDSLGSAGFTGSVAPSFELSQVMRKYSLSDICFTLAAQVVTRNGDGKIVADIAEIGEKL